MIRGIILFILGVYAGITLMCLFQINRYEKMEKRSKKNAENI